MVVVWGSRLGIFGTENFPHSQQGSFVSFLDPGRLGCPAAATYRPRFWKRKIHQKYTWIPNDPCFDWKTLCFGGLTFKNNGHLGSRYVYLGNLLYVNQADIKPCFGGIPLLFTTIWGDLSSGRYKLSRCMVHLPTFGFKSVVNVGKYSSLHGFSGHKKPLPMRGFFGRKFQQIPGTYPAHPKYGYIWPNYNLYIIRYILPSPTFPLKDVCPLF